ncbi:hypothetical protein MAMT_01022 [Methylacidimicrobium tartarophylax]|uniref:Uncharacterized protein n=1 Tax=Methylacidimicrobium tartarophylax TaxID=1041768 RepID=A0A5E6M9D4_9BACT|nr:hypothetical protein MAMT_01022 [Methylacidimicrobium tartarophylax]
MKGIGRRAAETVPFRRPATGHHRPRFAVLPASRHNPTRNRLPPGLMRLMAFQRLPAAIGITLDEAAGGRMEK